jgi:hypothetical protein
MEIELRQRFLTAVPLVGSRVHWQIRPQNGQLPAIVLTVVSGARSQNMDGFDGFQATRVQVDCYALTYDEAAQMREAIYDQVIPAGTVGGKTFLRAFVNNAMDRGEDTTPGYIHRQMLDLTFWHN